VTVNDQISLGGLFFRVLGVAAMLIGSGGVWLSSAPGWVKFGMLFAWGFALLRGIGAWEDSDTRQKETTEGLRAIFVAVERLHR